MSIITELYLGNLRPDENFHESIELKSTWHTIDEYENKIRSDFDSESLKDFEQLCICHIKAERLIGAEYFEYGFKLGMALCAASLSESLHL